MAASDVMTRPWLVQSDRAEAVPLVSVGDVPRAHQVSVVAAFLLGAMVRDALGDPDTARRALPGRHLEDPTPGEIRVLYYLPTNLTAPEIADNLYLSVNTVKTHMRHLYAKLSAHSRTQAVEQARALGLLPPGRPAGRAAA